MTSHESSAGLTFADIESRTRRPRNICPRCGGPTAAMMRVILQESGSKPKSIAARGITLCEPCSVAAYNALVEKFEEVTARGE